MINIDDFLDNSQEIHRLGDFSVSGVTSIKVKLIQLLIVANREEREISRGIMPILRSIGKKVCYRFPLLIPLLVDK